MDTNLHQQQGINHLSKVLAYAPFVAEGRRANVHLTQEDWYVVADTLFQMNTPLEVLPSGIKSYRLTNDNRTIEILTDEFDIDLEMIG